MTEDEFQAWLRRQDKPPTRALPQSRYRDPATQNFSMRRKGADMDRQSDREKADSLLIEHHRWSAAYRPNLGAPKISPYCRESMTSKQYDDPADLTHDKVYQNEMKAVDYCLDTLPVPMQQAIGTEMRNRVATARVWRSPSNVSFAAALDAVIPVMRKRGLFD
jgi:hypothetical protein